jgi:rare lipoprotein A (peptidoglycan hydrolase)
MPLGTDVRVTSAEQSESVIDPSYAAARKIGLIRSGTGRVSLVLLIGKAWRGA